jgi:hypothetical protein
VHALCGVPPPTQKLIRAGRALLTDADAAAVANGAKLMLMELRGSPAKVRRDARRLLA